jgi:hypothetical protein
MSTARPGSPPAATGTRQRPGARSPEGAPAARDPRPALARLCRAGRVRALYAFGSRERQARRLLGGAPPRGNADLDLAVLWLDPHDPRRFQRRDRLEDRLARMAPDVTIDLVEIDSAGTFLRAAALAGERLYAADHRELDACEELAWAMAGDLMPVHRETTRELVEILREGAPR